MARGTRCLSRGLAECTWRGGVWFRLDVATDRERLRSLTNAITGIVGCCCCCWCGRAMGADFEESVGVCVGGGGRMRRVWWATGRVCGEIVLRWNLVVRCFPMLARFFASAGNGHACIVLLMAGGS